MGCTLSRWMYEKRSIRVLVTGLDAAGKTTMLYQLKLGEVVTTIPTIGFNVETIESNGVNIVAWDIGLRSKSRPLMRHYYPNTQALIFVVDCTDIERLDETKEFLKEIISEDELYGAPLLVMANKQDLLSSCTPEKLAEVLDLKSIKGRPWHIVPCSATSGQGLTEGLDWLVSAVTGKLIKEDLTQSINTSVKDVTDMKSQIQQKTAPYGMDYLNKGWGWIKALAGYRKG